jgi:hypothetical protein
VGVTYVAPYVRQRSFWIADADGRHAVQLGPGCRAVWSRDSRRFYYVAQADSGEVTTHVVRADGSNDHVTTAHVTAPDPTVSPNGRWSARATRDAILINGRVATRRRDELEICGRRNVLVALRTRAASG